MTTNNSPSINAYNKICNLLHITPSKVIEPETVSEGVSLVIVPNIVLSHLELFRLAEIFGDDQPYETYIYKELYERYTSQELCGGKASAGYRKIYIPHTNNVPSGTPKTQRAQLTVDQHVPTVFEGICYWFTLREAGLKLDYDTTYIRHFNLQPKRVGRWSYVPRSCVRGGGEAGLGGSLAGLDRGGRVSVGSNLKLASPVSSSSLEALEQRVLRLEATLANMKEVL